MKLDFSRRAILRGMATTALAPAILPLATAAQADKKPWWLGDGMPQEGTTTPKIATAISLSGGITDEAIRGVVQIGVYHVLSGGPAIPWSVEQLSPIVDKLKAAGVKLGNLMIGGFPNTIYGRPGRNEEIEKVRQSIQAAGRVGIPVVEYNFMPIVPWKATEQTGRGGAGLTGADYDRMQACSRCPKRCAYSTRYGPTLLTF
jgi:mannonate dehydratase